MTSPRNPRLFEQGIGISKALVRVRHIPGSDRGQHPRAWRIPWTMNTKEIQEQAERETAKLEKEKDLALAEVALKHKADLAAQKSELEEESAKVLSEKEQAFTRKLALQKKLLAEVAEEIGS